MTAPWCCLIALFEGYEIAHAEVCRWRSEPQTEALFPLPAPEPETGERP